MECAGFIGSAFAGTALRVLNMPPSSKSLTNTSAWLGAHSTTKIDWGVSTYGKTVIVEVNFNSYYGGLVDITYTLSFNGAGGSTSHSCHYPGYLNTSHHVSMIASATPVDNTSFITITSSADNYVVNMGNFWYRITEFQS